MVDALEHIHSKGFAHRDLKLENIILDEDFNLKICDFGLSTNESSVKNVVGTKVYMAPEQLANQTHDPKLADIYSLGVILFVMRSSCFPYSTASDEDDLVECLKNKDFIGFWEKQAYIHRNDPIEFSVEFKDLLNWIMSFVPGEWPDFDQLRNHAWYNDQELDDDQVHEELFGKPIVMRAPLRKLKILTPDSPESSYCNSTADESPEIPEYSKKDGDCDESSEKKRQVFIFNEKQRQQELLEKNLERRAIERWLVEK